MPTITRIPSVANMTEIEREALAFWLGQAATAAGITDRKQRIALQAQLAALMGEATRA